MLAVVRGLIATYDVFEFRRQIGKIAIKRRLIATYDVFEFDMPVLVPCGQCD